MSVVEVRRSPVLGLPVVTYRVMSGDPRGPFCIPFELSGMEPLGLNLMGPVRQLNMSQTRLAHTTRGLHVSNTGKYCFAPLEGAGFWNPVVDLTGPASPTYGGWEAFELVPGTALYVPPGYGNGLQALGDGAVYLYMLDGDFDPQGERVVDLSDPDIGIAWPNPTLEVSAKDAAGMSLLEYTRQLRGATDR